VIAHNRHDPKLHFHESGMILYITYVQTVVRMYFSEKTNVLQAGPSLTWINNELKYINSCKEEDSELWFVENKLHIYQ